MGFNSVAFLLNDMMSELERSPRTVAYGLSHPPMSDSPEAIARWHQMVREIADRFDEPVPNHQAFEMLGTFHADSTKVVAFGGNHHTVLLHTGGDISHHTDEGKLKLLKKMADELGYCVRKKAKRKPRKTAPKEREFTQEELDAIDEEVDNRLAASLQEDGEDPNSDSDRAMFLRQDLQVEVAQEFRERIKNHD